MSQHYVSEEQGLDGIQQAIDAATAGDVVVCKPGVYEGDATLRLKSGVDLVSEDGAKKTTLRQNVVNVEIGNAVILADKVENILIAGFHLGFFHIDQIKGISDIGIITVQFSDNIRIEHNIIEYSCGYGISYSGSGGAISSNLISNHNNHGINISCLEGKPSDVTINDGNQIEGNNRNGIVYAASNGSVRGNAVINNQGVGIRAAVYEGLQSDVVIEDGNQIEGNNRSGIVYAGSNGSVRGNAVINNQGNGIQATVYEGLQSDVVIEDGNQIEGNNESGIVYGGSNGSVRGNAIINNQGAGIQAAVYEGLQSDVVIEDGNQIEGNNGSGIVYAGSNGTVRGNAVINNQGSGIQATVYEGLQSDVVIEDGNQIEGNNGIGIIYAGSNGSVRANAVINNQEHGIQAAVYEGLQSDVVIEDGNQIEGNNGIGIIFAGSNGTVRGNAVINNQRAGIQAEVDEGLQSDLVIEDGNQIEGNNTSGIAYAGSNGSVRGNAIINNQEHGIQVLAREGVTSDVVIEDGNQIEGNKRCGIAYGGSNGIVRGNAVINNQGNGIQILAREGVTSDVSVLQNIIYGHSSLQGVVGISIEPGCRLCAIDNLIHRNAQAIACNMNDKENFFEKNLSWVNEYNESSSLKGKAAKQGEWHHQYNALLKDSSKQFVRAGLGWGALEDVRDALPESEEIHLDTSHLSGMSYQPTDDATGFDSKPHGGWPTSLSGSLHRLLQSHTHDKKHGQHDAAELPDCIVVLEAGIPDQYGNELMKHAEIKWPKKADDLVYWEMVNGSSEADSGSSKEDKKSAEKSPESRLGMAMQENDQPCLKSLFFSMLVRAILLYLVPILVVFAVALYVEPVWIQPALQGLFSLGIGEYILVILASWLLFTHFIIPSHINIIPQKIINLLDAISSGVVTAVADLLTPNMLIRFRERLWIEQRFFRRWPIFGKRKMVVLFWDDVDSTNKKDIEYIELIRDLAQKNGVPFLLFVSLHDAGLLPVCLPRIRDNYSGKFIPWMVLKENAGLIVPHEGLGSQDIIQHLFGSRKNILSELILNTSNIDPTDMPLLLALASRYRLPLRYGFPIEPIDEDNPNFTGVVRKPSFVDVQTWLENTISNEKKWPVKKPIHEECYKSLPGEGYENGRWVWCHSQSITLNKDDKTQCSWQVLVTRPAYRQVVRKALENWEVSGSSVYADVFHVHLDVAVGETIYLNWAMSFLQEGANGELDDDQRELAYAYASLALHSATDCLLEKDATNHFPKLYDLRGKVIEVFLQSDHPEPERIAGLLLHYSGLLGEDEKYQKVDEKLALMLRSVNSQFNRLRATANPINEVEKFEPTACALIEKLNADLVQKIDTLIFSSPNLSSALFRRFKSVYWHWIKDVVDVEVPSEFEPRTSDDLKRDFYNMWLQVWETGEYSKAVAIDMGRRCAHAPVESVAAMIGSAKWYVQRRVRLEAKSSDDSLNTLVGPEVFALSRLFTQLMKDWDGSPKISDIVLLKRLPFFTYWSEFRKAMKKEEDHLKKWSQPPAIQLEGVGYGMGRNEDVHQIEWYRDGRLVELVE